MLLQEIKAAANHQHSNGIRDLHAEMLHSVYINDNVNMLLRGSFVISASVTNKDQFPKVRHILSVFNFKHKLFPRTGKANIYTCN